ncbi:hypothetical protein BDV28DRAFT_132044 [Aspergillus coremiiformis]|uniref:Uncharacterized protein n=1 Tax=Aspergillus coremiiformis TaxID=138285 RepID=A0A5N6ZD58_9EURO|nr:hypothetical protein BDV28DRAFT_132044 [Aspergillus coremiiformis]
MYGVSTPYLLTVRKDWYMNPILYTLFSTCMVSNIPFYCYHDSIPPELSTCM